MFPTDASDPKLCQLMEHAFGAACLEIDVASMLEFGKAAETMMALRIMTTVAAGERDPARLKDLALQAVDGRRIDGCQRTIIDERITEPDGHYA